MRPKTQEENRDDLAFRRCIGLSRDNQLLIIPGPIKREAERFTATIKVIVWVITPARHSDVIIYSWRHTSADQHGNAYEAANGTL